MVYNLLVPRWANPQAEGESRWTALNQVEILGLRIRGGSAGEKWKWTVKEENWDLTIQSDLLPQANEPSSYMNVWEILER